MTKPGVILYKSCCVGFGDILLLVVMHQLMLNLLINIFLINLYLWYIHKIRDNNKCDRVINDQSKKTNSINTIYGGNQNTHLRKTLFTIGLYGGRNANKRLPPRDNDDAGFGDAQEILQKPFNKKSICDVISSEMKGAFFNACKAIRIKISERDLSDTDNCLEGLLVSFNFVKSLKRAWDQFDIFILHERRVDDSKGGHLVETKLALLLLDLILCFIEWENFRGLKVLIHKRLENEGDIVFCQGLLMNQLLALSGLPLVNL
ncbi:hypothetical protein ACJX0J_039941 [Zea mays]